MGEEEARSTSTSHHVDERNSADGRLMIRIFGIEKGEKRENLLAKFSTPLQLGVLVFTQNVLFSAAPTAFRF